MYVTFMRMSLLAAVLLVTACSSTPADVAGRPSGSPTPAVVSDRPTGSPTAGPCEQAAALTRQWLKRAADAIPALADDPAGATQELAVAANALNDPRVSQAVSRCRDADPQQGEALSLGIVAVTVTAGDALTAADGGSTDDAGMDRDLQFARLRAIRSALQVGS